MQRTHPFKGSLVRQLVLAFILVAVPPMLIAGKVTTGLVNSAVNSNVEHWLRNATWYILASLDEVERELKAVHMLLYNRFGQKEIAFTQEELEALSDLDVDVVTLRDAAGKMILVNSPVRDIESVPLFPSSSMKWVSMEDGSRELAVVVESAIKAWDGSMRTLALGNFFAIQLSETGKEEPVGVRVFLPADDGFTQVYSSTSEVLPEIPRKALDAVMTGTGEVFVPDRDWTDSTSNVHLFLKGLYDGQGEIVAIFAVSAHMRSYSSWLPNSEQLLGGFFVVGMLLASSVGFFLAKRIVRPVKLLNEGVKNIAGGNLGYRIVVHGGDEIAELSSGFNLMVSQLEAMRRDNVESARQERSRMLGEIALGFAHEIRNPLMVIKTSAELVHAKLPGTSKDSRMMGFVVDEVGRIDSLVREFLAFATPDAVTFEPFHLHKLAQDVLDFSAAEFARRGVRYSLVVEAENCVVLGEQNQIRQVVLNLLLNAMDAMPEGGDLGVRIHESEDKRYVCMDVVDTGSGIPDDVLPSIYKPFKSTKKGGLGLGLAKVHAIVEAHGGSITCSSAPRGTTFTVCLSRGN